MVNTPKPSPKQIKGANVRVSPRKLNLTRNKETGKLVATKDHVKKLHQFHEARALKYMTDQAGNQWKVREFSKPRTLSVLVNLDDKEIKQRTVENSFRLKSPRTSRSGKSPNRGNRSANKTSSPKSKSGSGTFLGAPVKKLRMFYENDGLTGYQGDKIIPIPVLPSEDTPPKKASIYRGPVYRPSPKRFSPKRDANKKFLSENIKLLRKFHEGQASKQISRQILKQWQVRRDQKKLSGYATKQAVEDFIELVSPKAKRSTPRKSGNSSSSSSKSRVATPSSISKSIKLSASQCLASGNLSSSSSKSRVATPLSISKSIKLSASQSLASNKSSASTIIPSSSTPKSSSKSPGSSSKLKSAATLSTISSISNIADFDGEDLDLNDYDELLESTGSLSGSISPRRSKRLSASGLSGSPPRTPRTPGGTLDLYKMPTKTTFPPAVKRAVDFIEKNQALKSGGVPEFLFMIKVEEKAVKKFEELLMAGETPEATRDNLHLAARLFVIYLVNTVEPVLPKQVWNMSSDQLTKDNIKGTMGAISFLKLREVFHVLLLLARKEKMKKTTFTNFSMNLTEFLTHEDSEKARNTVMKLLTDFDKIFF